MKIKLTNVEASKIIIKKIISLQKIIKKIKVDRNGKFIKLLFQRFEDIQKISINDSDFFEDNAQLTFSLYVYTNVNLSLFSNTFQGCNYGISAFEIDKDHGIVHTVDNPFYEISNEAELKEYFSQIDMILPNNIEVVELKFTARFEDAITEHYYRRLLI